MLMRRAAVLAILAPLGIAGCGDGGQPSEEGSPYVGPKEVVETFYAASAELDCEGAADVVLFREDGVADRESFIEACRTADDLSGAQQAVVGDPVPSPDSDLADIQDAFPEATDMVSVSVMEGSEGPNDYYVVEIDGEWLLLI